MENYQEMYNKLKIQLENLEDKLLELKSKKEISGEEYSDLFRKISNQRFKLSYLNGKKELMPSSKYTTIDFFVPLLTAFSVLLLINLYSTVCYVLFSSLLKIINPWPFFITSFLGGLIIIETGVQLQKKINKKIKQYSSNKIINSDEYQEVLKKINELEDEVKLVEDKILCKGDDLHNVRNEYSSLGKEILDKKALINYMDNEMGEQDELIDEKSLVRKRIKK